MQCKDIPDEPILKFLAAQKDERIGGYGSGDDGGLDGYRWCTWGDPFYMPTVQNAMPPGTPPKLQLAKMRKLIDRGLVDGCACGCRGDFHPTAKGLAYIALPAPISKEG